MFQRQTVKHIREGFQSLFLSEWNLQPPQLTSTINTRSRRLTPLHSHLLNSTITMSFLGEKSEQTTNLARRTTPKSHLNKFLTAALLTSAALYSCRTKVLNGIEEVLLTPFAPEPKDYCKQVEPFDASNWTTTYDVKGFEAKAAEWLGGAVRIPYVCFTVEEAPYSFRFENRVV
jgi:hypothetical protein